MRDEIFRQISEERDRQDAKFGEQNHLPVEWMPILMEEVGEVAKEALENHFNHLSLYNYRTELIQVAAVAVSMAESFDRAYPNTVKTNSVKLTNNSVGARMTTDQQCQLDCRRTSCRFNLGGGKCSNTSPALTLNSNGSFICWSYLLI